MARNQLEMVARWEQEKEDKAAQMFQQAQAFVVQNQQKLDGLLQYRLDYFKKIQARGMEGLEALSFSHHQTFIGKLDKACEQQRALIVNAKQAAQQRKDQWLVQQRKRKAVDLLLEKRRLEQQSKMDKQEQAMMDEVALQKFIRAKIA